MTRQWGATGGLRGGPCHNQAAFYEEFPPWVGAVGEKGKETSSEALLSSAPCDASLNQAGGHEKRERSLPVIKHTEIHGFVYWQFSKCGPRTFAVSLRPFRELSSLLLLFFISKLNFFFHFISFFTLILSQCIVEFFRGYRGKITADLWQKENSSPFY